MPKLALSNVTTHVYNYLYDQIANLGELKPNQKIKITDICAFLGVSATPVREALIQLAHDGYLQKRQRRGFVVRVLDKKEFTDIIRILGVLEGLAASLACPQMTKVHIEKLRRCISKMDASIKNSNFRGYYEHQLEFHNIFISECDNNELIAVINLLKKRFFRQDYDMHATQDSLRKAVKQLNIEHNKIIEYFEKGDAVSLDRFLREVHWVSHGV